MNHFFKILFLLTLISACHQPKSIQDIPSQYIQTKNGKIHYKTYGTKLPAMIFVHGFGCDMYAWENQFSYFASKHQLVFIDLPGYGQSDKPETEYTLDFFASAVKSILDTLQINNVTLVGHSLGTPICRCIIQIFPELDATLCDVDGVYCFYPTDTAEYNDYKNQISFFTESFNNNANYTKNINGFIQNLFTPATPELVKQYATERMPKTQSRIAYSTMKNLVNEKYWDKSAIAVPTLVFCSKNSQIPSNYQSIMSQLYPNMNYQEWDTIGHFMMMEQPERFNKVLEKFIENNK